MRNRNNRTILIIAAGCFASLMAARSAYAGAVVNKTITTKTYSLTQFCNQLDGQWLGAIAASDGNIYFGSSTHSTTRGAMFFKFDPRTEALTPLCDDITHVCGEDPSKTTPQGKLHSNIVEHDGWLYMGTHYAVYTPAGAANYPGPHLVGYNLATGQFRDYGSMAACYTNYAGLALDPARRKIYMFITPVFEAPPPGSGAKLIRVDIDTGAREDMGLFISGGETVFDLFVDSTGDCWFMTLNNPRLYHTNAVARTTTMVQGNISANQVWRYVFPHPDGKRALAWKGDWYTTATVGVFDPLSPTSPEIDLFQSARGPYFACADTRRMYWTEGPQQDDPDDHLVSGAAEAGGQFSVMDYGMIIDQDGRKPWRLGGMASDGRGTIYMVGDWFNIAGDAGTLRDGAIRNTQQRLCVAHVGMPPAAAISGALTGAAGGTLAFDGSGSSDPDGSVSSWQWNFGDGATAAGQSASHTWSAAGVYMVTLTVTDDMGLTGTEIAQVVIGAVPDASGGAIGFASLAQRESRLAGQGTIAIARTGGAAGAATVSYSTAPGTAVEGVDYGAASGTLYWADGDGTTQMFTVPIYPGVAGKADATVLLALSGATGAQLGTSAAVLIIADPLMSGTLDSFTSGTIMLGSTTYSVMENAGSVMVPVYRDGASCNTILVGYATANSTGAAGVDYTAVSGTLVWVAGDTASKTITIPIIDNSIPQTNRTFTITLINPQGAAAVGSPSSATITIIDDDKPGTVQLSATNYSVMQHAAYASIPVTRTGGSLGAVSVQYSTSNGTGIAGIDYVAASGSLSWASGDSASKTFKVYPIAGTLVASNKTVTLRLSGVTGGATLGRNRSTLTIVNDNQPGTLAFIAGTFSGPENSGTIALTVSRTGGMRGVATVSYAAADGTAKAGVNYLLAAGSLTWADGDSANKNIAVTLIDDGARLGDAAFAVTLSNATVAALGAQSSAAGVIIETDVIYGDANMDGKFSLADLNTVVDWILLRTPPPVRGMAAFTTADVNGDQKVDLMDLNIMVDKLLLRIPKFPVEP
jgi:PKD repeat protein